MTKLVQQTFHYDFVISLTHDRLAKLLLSICDDGILDITIIGVDSEKKNKKARSLFSKIHKNLGDIHIAKMLYNDSAMTVKIYTGLPF
jgi:hypothetical protein